MYNGEKKILGICKCILKYIMWLNKMFINLKQIKYIILGIKPYFCKNKIIIVSYRYNGKG